MSSFEYATTADIDKSDDGDKLRHVAKYGSETHQKTAARRLEELASQRFKQHEDIIRQSITPLLELMDEAEGWGSKREWPRLAEYPQYEEIRRIGKRLFDVGGRELMLDVHAVVANRCDGAFLEHFWNGIGDWFA